MPYNDYFQEPSATASLEEKIAIIKKNKTTAINMLANLKDYKRISNNNSSGTINISSPANLEPKVKEENENIRNLLNKISLLDIEGLSDEDILEAMRNILKDYPLSQMLIDRLKLLLYKELIIYNKMVLTASDTKEKEDLDRAIDAISTKIALLDELIETQDVSEEELCDTNNNNIFFLTNASGKVIIRESLTKKSFPPEYYPLVKELISDIKNGNFHKVKRFAIFNYLEMRLYDVRILFERLSRGNYIIIDAIIKKYKNGNYGNKKLEHRMNQFNSKKPFYLENHQKEEFIKEHEGYLAEILSILDSKTLGGDEQDEKRNI